VKLSSISTAILLAAACGGFCADEPDWALARPGWVYEFPRDHHAHPDFKTEWWYLTGNLADGGGRRYGFQLTFFRQGVRRSAPADTRFAVDDIKLAHFAVTDIDGNKFRFAQKVSRGSFGEAGFADGNRIAWIDDWELVQTGPGAFVIRAKADDFALRLDLVSRKPPVFHGKDGVSQKSEGEGRASHYYSLTRLEAAGSLTLGREEVAVTGLAWFDQEWATNQLTEDQTGWDWLSLQFEDGTELMLFQIRLRGGGRDPFCHGTWVAADGRTEAIKNEDFELLPGRTWKSPESGGEYPVAWTLRIPRLGLELEVEAALDAQELVLAPISYWEGSILATGTKGGREVRGRGYLEMTGYAGGLVGLQAPGTR
jgi:predicted secreted hydrolase